MSVTNDQLAAKIDARGAKVDTRGAKVDTRGAKVDTLDGRVKVVEEAISDRIDAAEAIRDLRQTVEQYRAFRKLRPLASKN